jgi:hypothetical protein
MRLQTHSDLLEVMTKLSSDYKPWGDVERWADESKNYPDCSMGCLHYKTLVGELGADWGVCINKSSPRFGLLTFEHQAGLNCFEQ